MSVLSLVLLTVSVCALHTKGQLEPLRSAPVVLRDQCLQEGSIADQASDTSETLARIAESIVNGTRSDGCLDSIYVMVFTSSMSVNAGSNHPHKFEVVGAAQTRQIALPDRPGDYERHQGDIWKLDVFDVLGFLPGTCLRLCNIESVRLVNGGNDGWLIDSAVTFGCIDDVGCSLLTQNLDVHQWVDGNGVGDVDDLHLALATQSSCV